MHSLSSQGFKVFLNSDELNIPIDEKVWELANIDRNLLFREENLHLLNKVSFPNKSSAFSGAIFHGDLEFIKKMLVIGGTNLLNVGCCSKMTPVCDALNIMLSLARQTTEIERIKRIQSIIKTFLAFGADVNLIAPLIKDRWWPAFGYTPVKGSEEMQSYSPLTMAAHDSKSLNFELITLFLRHGARTDWIKFSDKNEICQNIEKGIKLVAQENFMLVLRGRVSSGSILNKIPREIVDLILNCISGVMHKEQRCFRSQGD